MGFSEIKNVTGVFINGNEVVITGTPNEDDEKHNCDEMGCGSCDHVLLLGLLRLKEKGYDESKQEAGEGEPT